MASSRSSNGRGKRSSSRTPTLANPPSYLEQDKLKFLIMDAPTDNNLTQYLQVMKKHDVRVVVRACEPSYNAKVLNDANISVEEMFFADGAPPAADIVKKWLDIVESESAAGRCVAVHCVAGLGRAPVLVGIALVEKLSMEYSEAVTKIRKARRGAINQRQLKYLKTYVPTSQSSTCVIM